MRPERILPTDDADMPLAERNELVIWQGGNGDWYVATRPEGTKGIGRSVRLSMSGGTSSRAPGVLPSLAQMYELMPEAGA